MLNKAQKFKNLLDGDLSSVRSSIIFEDDKTEKEVAHQNSMVSGLQNRTPTPQLQDTIDETEAEQDQPTTSPDDKWSKFYKD